MKTDVEFEVNVLKIDGVTLPDELRKELLANATYIRKLNVWLFEGDWEICLLPWKESIKCLGEIFMPAYGGWSQKRLSDFVESELP